MIDEVWQLKGMFFGLFDHDYQRVDVYKVIHVTPEANAVGVLISDDNKINFISRTVGGLVFYKTQSETIYDVMEIASKSGWLNSQDTDQPKPSNQFDLEEVLKDLPVVKD